MGKNNKVVLLILLILALVSTVNATQNQVLVEFKEYVDQQVLYNPLKTGSGIWFDTNENQSEYNLTGYIIISNVNPNGKTISDIFVGLEYTDNITLPAHYAGRNGTFILNNPASGELILHIPELRTGENATFLYSVNETNIVPPLNFTSAYSDTKLLAGNNITVYDTIENVFDNYPFQAGNTCMYNINITQVTVPIMFTGIPQNYTYVPASIAGTDAGNVAFSGDVQTLYWDVRGGGCLNKTEHTDINYIVSTPLNIPKTTNYYMINTTIRYDLNQTISHLKLNNITAVSEAEIDFEKRIMKPSHPTLHGSNVTWNITGYMRTATNISYNLTSVTFWVSQRNVAGVYTDPNTIDNDTISNATLEYSMSPFTIVNRTVPWSSTSWLFNYSDIPSPIVWMDVNFTIADDGTQLINRSITRNNNDIYIKEVYLIIGYWLEIEKNITSVGNNTYHISIYVHNKGNQVTPADTIVTIYDFVPAAFNITSTPEFTYSISPWYNTAHANNTIIGLYNGTLHQWGLIPTVAGGLNTSFAAGPVVNENTTWSVDFNVTGEGDYQLLDVFVTGLDPQQVDGAGASSAVIVNELIERVKSTEGVFATVASILLLLGLLL